MSWSIGRHEAEKIVWLSVLAAIGFLVFLPGLEIGYYGDDFLFVYEDPSSRPLHAYFFQNHPLHAFYRPVEAAYMAFVQTHFGMDTFPIHVTAVSIHILLSWVVFLFALDLGLSRLSAVLASAYMLVSQANVHAVLSVDTLSQVWATLFGFSGLWLLYRHNFVTEGPASSRIVLGPYYVLSLVIFALSLLSKETGVSFIPALVAVILFKHSITNKTGSWAKRTLIQATPYMILTVLYLIIRAEVVPAQPTFGPEPYHFRIGSTTLINIGQLLFAGLCPVSTVTAFVTYKTGQITTFIAIVSASVLFVGIVGRGLWNSQLRITFLIILLLSVAALFPMALMNHVSELYTYNAMPFISLLVGSGLAVHLEQCHRRGTLALSAALAGLILINHVILVQKKAGLMNQCGERAAELLKRVQPYAANLPKHGRLVLLNPENHQLEYSVFLSKGFNVLQCSQQWIKQRVDRWDITINIVDPSNLHTIECKDNCDVVTLVNDEVRLLRKGVAPRP